MGKNERQHKMESNKLAKLNERKAELEAKSKESKAALVDSKRLFGEQLVQGDSSIDNLADGLARKQAEGSVYESALNELNQQIVAQETRLAEAEQRLDSERKAESTRKLRIDAVELIKRFGDTQIELARLEKFQQENGVQIIDYKAAALRLADTQVLIEADPVVREKSKVPHAGRIGGWLDENHSRPTRGAPVIDWAWGKTA